MTKEKLDVELNRIGWYLRYAGASYYQFVDNLGSSVDLWLREEEITTKKSRINLCLNIKMLTPRMLDDTLCLQIDDDATTCKNFLMLYIEGK